MNLFIGIMSFGAWLMMAVFTEQTGALSAANFSNLKFFTVLSNLLNGVTALWYACVLLRGGNVSRRLSMARLTGTAVIGLTFLTVMGFLGPLFGYGSMFRGANLWMHLILPILTFFSFLLFENGAAFTVRETLKAAIPTLIYEIGYLLNIIVNGIGIWPDTNDFYGFLTWGYGVGVIIAFGMLLLTWGIAYLLQRLKRHKT